MQIGSHYGFNAYINTYGVRGSNRVEILTLFALNPDYADSKIVPLKGSNPPTSRADFVRMDNGERDMISLESDLFKKDPVITQHIMQMIDTDIFWYEKTFRGILMELRKIRNGKTITKASEEHSEKEMINPCNESHAMLNDLRLYKGEKTQQDYNDMTSVSVSSKAQKNWPRKCFQINENENCKSAMMCWLGEPRRF